MNQADVVAFFMDNRVVLKWTFSSASNISGYEIYRTTKKKKNQLISANATTAQTNSFIYEDFDENISGKVEYTIKMRTSTGEVQLPVATVFIKRIKEFSLNIRNNIFSKDVSLEYSIPYDCTGRISIIDKTGRDVLVIMNGNLSKGFHSYLVTKERLSSGIYFVRLESGEIIKTLKMIKL